MKIGILLTGHAPDELHAQTGDYDTVFTRLLDGHGLSFDSYSVVDGVFPTGADAADGWLITGSKHGVYEDHDWIPPLETLVRDIHARDLPLIGVCFGHQIIAQALGGKVEKFSGGWSIGRTEYQTPDGPLVLNAWHQDQITRLPEGAQVLAQSDFCANAVLAYGDNIWTVQPHPEFTPNMIDVLIRTRGRGLVPDPILDAAEAKFDQPHDSARIATQMARFFTDRAPARKATA